MKKHTFLCEEAIKTVVVNRAKNGRQHFRHCSSGQSRSFGGQTCECDNSEDPNFIDALTKASDGLQGGTYVR